MLSCQAAESTRRPTVYPGPVPAGRADGILAGADRSAGVMLRLTSDEEMFGRDGFLLARPGGVRRQAGRRLGLSSALTPGRRWPSRPTRQFRRARTASTPRPGTTWRAAALIPSFGDPLPRASIPQRALRHRFSMVPSNSRSTHLRDSRGSSAILIESEPGGHDE